MPDVRDDTKAIEILNYKAINIVEIEKYETNTDSERKYVFVNIEDGKDESKTKTIIVKLTDDFGSHYEEDEVIV